jgi:hypothetical protein
MTFTTKFTKTQANFYKRYGRQLLRSLNLGNVRDIFPLFTHPGFIWPEDGTYRLAKQGYKRSFSELFEYMKYKPIKGFMFHPDTIQICIRFCRSKLISILVSNGCEITRDDIVYMISKGLNHCLPDISEVLPSSFLEDLDLQLIAISNDQLDTFKILRRIQGRFHPQAIFEVIQKDSSISFFRLHHRQQPKS